MENIENSRAIGIPVSKRKHEDSPSGSKAKRSCLSTIENKFSEKTKKLKPLRALNAITEVDRLAHELTPCSALSSTSRYRPTLEFISPLPNFTWANSSELWNLMLKNDNQCYRDSLMFNRHPSLQPVMRATLLDWLNEVCQAYSLSRQTYYLALDFFDRFLSVKDDMPKRRLQLLGITCLFIAAKLEEIFPPKLDRFSFVCDGACDDEEILAQELVVLNALKWELNTMTPISWLNVYLQIYSSNSKENLPVGESFLIPNYHSQLFVQIAHLIDLCTLDSGSITFPYSVIAASAFFHFTNDSALEQCTGKKLSEVTECIEWMIPFAMAIQKTGFDFGEKFDHERSTTIQTHTINLELLQSAQSIQADLESEKMVMLETSDTSSFCSQLTPSKAPPTPPHL